MIIAADHRGFKLKESLKKKYEFRKDCTPNFKEGDDYPDVVKKLLKDLQIKEPAVIVCGSGTGVAIAANRHKGIRAVNGVDERHARMARKHEDANVLCLGSDFIKTKEAEKILKVFLTTKFLGGRYLRRLRKL